MLFYRYLRFIACVLWSIEISSMTLRIRSVQPVIRIPAVPICMAEFQDSSQNSEAPPAGAAILAARTEPDSGLGSRSRQQKSSLPSLALLFCFPPTTSLYLVLLFPSFWSHGEPWWITLGDSLLAPILVVSATSPREDERFSA